MAKKLMKRDARYTEELYRAYKSASKSKELLYVAIKRQLKALFPPFEPISKRRDRWNNYKMIAENYDYLSGNLGIGTLMITMSAIAFSNNLSLCGVSILAGLAIITGGLGIYLHMREHNFKYINKVLDDIKEELLEDVE